MPAPALERIRELIAAAEDTRRPQSYARQFDGALAAGKIRRDILANYEQDLVRLDDEAWRGLKAAAAKRLIRNTGKGWEPLFDILSEAKAYMYLAGLGCTDIRAIPTSYETKTPDLRAELEGRPVVCEVKTLNMSDDERTVREAAPRLSDDFLLGKLTWTLGAAKAQLEAFPVPGARKIVFVVFNPDASLIEYADDYAAQLGAFLKGDPFAELEVEIFQFPRFAPSPGGN